jgi:hypothetical protein
MKFARWWSLCLLLLGVFVTTSLAQGNASWTIIYYSGADTDLEGFMIGDLMEMNIVGSSDAVNIVMQMDRVEGYDAINGDWTDTRRFYVTQAQGTESFGDFAISKDGYIAQLQTINPEDLGLSQADIDGEIENVRNASQAEFEQYMLQQFSAPAGGGASPIGIQLESIENLGEVNMGAPEALTDFIVWSVANYPAEKYMVVISDHGAGWPGVVFDETDGDVLTLQDLDVALASALEQTGLEKIDVVGFDACLMSQIEVMKAVAPYADYLIASQEVIPGAGWEYVTPLTAMAQDPSMDATTMAQSIIDSYQYYYNNVMSGYENFDLNLYDLSQVDNVMSAIEAYSQAIQANPAENLEAIGKARDNAQLFGVGAQGSNFVDLVDYLQLFKNFTSDADATAAADGLIEAIRSFVLYRQATGEPGGNGVAIHFPPNLADYDFQAESYVSQTNGSMSAWTDFLATFYGTAVQTYQPENLTIAINNVVPFDEVASLYNPPVVVFETNGEGIINIDYYVSLVLEDGSEFFIDQSPLVFGSFDAEGEYIEEFPQGQAESEFTWSPEVPVLTDGMDNVYVLLYTDPQDTDTSTIYGTYTWQDGNTAESYIVVDNATGEFQSVWGYEGDTAVAEIKPKRGETFEPTWEFLNAEGEFETYPSGTQLSFGSESGIRFDFEVAPSGDYYFYMNVEDIAGNTSSTATAFSVNNDDINYDYKGFKDIQTGINFLYPRLWLVPDVQAYEDGSYGLFTSDDSGDLFLALDYYEVVSLDELTQRAADNLANFGATGDEAQATQVGGYDATLISYTYTDDNGIDHIGTQVVVYVEENGLGYIIDLDSTAERADEANELLGIILDSIQFFPPVAVGIQ